MNLIIFCNIFISLTVFITEPPKGSVIESGKKEIIMMKEIAVLTLCAMMLCDPAVGSGDISGDYGIFTEEQEIVTDGIPVTMKGNNEMISIAIWSDNGYAFSVSDSSGMSSGEMKQLVKNVR